MLVLKVIVFLIMSTLHLMQCVQSRSSSRVRSMSLVVDHTLLMKGYHDYILKGDNPLTGAFGNNKSNVRDSFFLSVPNGLMYTRRTTNPIRFKTYLERLLAYYETYDISNCSKITTTGVEDGLINILNRNVRSDKMEIMYVLTEASAMDFSKVYQFKNICRTLLSVQVNFIVTAHCQYRDSDFSAYYEIARACSGQVFHLDSKDNEELVEYIAETLNNEQTIVRTDVSANITNVQFTIDTIVDYAMISVTGENVQINKTSLNLAHNVIWMRNIKVIKIYDLEAGTYSVAVKAEGDISVAITTKPLKAIEYGFRGISPVVLNDTTKQPFGGNEYELWLNITDSPLRLYSAEILSTDEHLTYELLLNFISDGLYTTILMIPASSFRITVKGSHTKTGNRVKVTSFVVTPQEHHDRKYNKDPNYNDTDVAVIEHTADDLVYPNEPQYIYILLGSTKNIRCNLKFDDPHSIKWYIDGKDIHFSGSNMPLVGVTPTNQGNYTCVKINELETESVTYIVNVGYPPIFQLPQHFTTTVDWDGGKEVKTIYCKVDAKPEPKIEWMYNGNLINASGGPSLPIKGWGEYVCRVRNIHGHDQRIFNVISTGCLIDLTGYPLNRMPLLLNENSTWNQFEMVNEFLFLNSNDKLKLSCNKRERNAFCKSEITATCDHQDNFKVDGKLFKFTELRCNERVEPVVMKTGYKCINDNSETMYVGFNLDSTFLVVYGVCYDDFMRVPLYTRSKIPNINHLKEFRHDWYKHSGIESKSSYIMEEIEDVACDRSSRCCYAKYQLVNAQDVTYGPAQTSTFIEQLNSIMYWKPCHGSERVSWDALEDLVRYKAKEVDMTVWSGASEYDQHTKIPRYLWKVIRSSETDVLTIVYVNDKSPKEADILCTNICSFNGTSWVQSHDKFTYCCELKDFLIAFKLPGRVFTRLRY